MLKLGLIGKNVKYSYSKAIFEYLFAYTGIQASYELISKDKIDIKLLESYDGLNVTIPYKQEVLHMMDQLDRVTINTIKNHNNALELYNTDLDGFIYTLNKVINDTPINTVIILGSGAMSQMLQNYFRQRDVKVYVVSRHKDNVKYHTYESILSISADLIVNTTPCGMYPNLNETPIDSSIFKKVKYAIDLTYRPYTTQFLWDAKQAGVICSNGLDMLIVQALRAFEIWCDYSFTDKEIDLLVTKLKLHLVDKVLLIGMSYSGKTTLLNDRLFERFDKYDLDEEIVLQTNKSIVEIFEQEGEKVFRDYEYDVAKRISSYPHTLIASGGGLVLSEDAMKLFREHMCIYVDTPIDVIIARYHKENNTRPLLQSSDQIMMMFEKRKCLYKKYTDIKLSEIRKQV